MKNDKTQPTPETKTKVPSGDVSDAATCSISIPWLYRLMFSKIEYAGKNPIQFMNYCDEIVSNESGEWRRYRVGWDKNIHYWRVWYRPWLPIKTIKRIQWNRYEKNRKVLQNAKAHPPHAEKKLK